MQAAEPEAPYPSPRSIFEPLLEELYNPDAPMRTDSPQDRQESIEAALAAALSTQLQRESERLGLPLAPARIERASYGLLEIAGSARSGLQTRKELSRSMGLADW